MTLKILVTGANGQLGSELKRVGADQHAFTFVDVDEMDLLQDKAIDDFFDAKDFDFVINCAAYTAVDRAEEESAIAYRVNSDSVATIARNCLARKIRLIQISTDYVFDGNGNQPISETAQVNPLSVYGKSKLGGETNALKILKDAYVIRTAWVYSTFGKNFVKTIAQLARQRDTLGVVCDQIGTPTYARDLAVTLVKIAEQIHSGKADVPGIYHYSNEGAISWYDLACFIVQYYDLPCSVKPITTEEYKTLAVRPKFTVLDKRKLKNTFGLEIPHWHKSLIDCLNNLSL